ncbi:MAG: PEPxxWA-CTERM sorting domain-containing protein [Pseudomonadota bacterium]
MKRVLMSALLSACLSAGAAGAAHAVAFPLNNASFERDVVADNTSRPIMERWARFGGAGTWNPPATSFGSIPNGVNVGYVDSIRVGVPQTGSFSQGIGSGVDSSKIYTLSADIGRAMEYRLTNFAMEMVLGDVVLASATFGESDIAAGSFRRLTLQYQSDQDLTGSFFIRFRSFYDPAQGVYDRIRNPEGYRLVAIDNVGFDISDAPVAAGVPEPATWALMIGGFGLTGATLRRRRFAPVAA